MNQQVDKQSVSADKSIYVLKTFFKDYYISVIAVLLIVVSFLAVFLPQLQNIFALQAQVKTQSASFETYTEKLAILSALSEAELNSQISLVEVALPSEKPAFSTLAILELASEKFELTVDNFEFSPGLLATESALLKTRSNSAKGASDLDSILVDLNIEGAYEGLLAFVDYLENSLPIVDVSSVAFSAKSDDGQVSATLSLIVYYSPIPKTIGKISDPLAVLTSTQLAIYEMIKSYPRVIVQISPYTSNDRRNNPFDY